MITQKRSFRKVSGGKYHKQRKKKLAQKGSMPVLTKVADKILKKIVRATAGEKKTKLYFIDNINVYDPDKKVYSVVKIDKVVGNDANLNYIKRNILNKGAVLETKLGKVKVTSRPGQNGSLSGILLKE